MAAALRPVSQRYTFVTAASGRAPKVTCFACGCVLRSNAVVDEGSVHHTCTAKPQRHADACGAVYWIVSPVLFPGGKLRGAFVAHTTHAELLRLDAEGYTVEQKLRHFLNTPHPDHR